MLPRLEQTMHRGAHADIYSSRYEQWANIAAMVDTLGIGTEQIKGNILIVGFGGGFQEAPLISEDVTADPLQLDPHISTLTCIDAEMAFMTDEFDRQDRVVVHAYTSTHTFASELWNGVPFDSIFMLRVQVLQQQLENGLDKDIATMLDESGIFVVTGNDKALPYMERSNYLRLVKPPINLDQYADPYYFNAHHYGFVCMKK